MAGMMNILPNAPSTSPQGLSVPRHASNLGDTTYGRTEIRLGRSTWRRDKNLYPRSGESTVILLLWGDSSLACERIRGQRNGTKVARLKGGNKEKCEARARERCGGKWDEKGRERKCNGTDMMAVLSAFFKSNWFSSNKLEGCVEISIICWNLCLRRSW